MESTKLDAHALSNLLVTRLDFVVNCNYWSFVVSSARHDVAAQMYEHRAIFHFLLRNQYSLITSSSITLFI